MIYLNLFLGFLKVGLFSFGGAYAAIPLIRDVVLSYGWMTDEEVAYMIAISESTPGPIMVNMATYVGSSQAGFWGAVLATFSVVLPAFFIIVLIMSIMKHALKNRYVQAVMNGLAPCIIGIILATGLYMGFSNIVHIKTDYFFDLRALIITAILICFMLVYKKLKKKQMSPFALIIMSVACGILIY